LTSPSGEAGRTPANVSLSARCLSRVRSSHNSCQQMARGLGARRTRTSRRQSDDHQQARGLSHRRRWVSSGKTWKPMGLWKRGRRDRARPHHAGAPTQLPHRGARARALPEGRSDRDA